MGIWRGNIESISDDCRKRRCQLHRHFYFSHGAWYSNNFQSYPSSLGRHNCSSWSWESTSTFLPNRSHRIHPLPFPSLTIQAEFSPFPPPPSPPPHTPTLHPYHPTVYDEIHPSFPTTTVQAEFNPLPPPSHHPTVYDEINPSLPSPTVQAEFNPLPPFPARGIKGGNLSLLFLSFPGSRAEHNCSCWR